MVGLKEEGEQEVFGCLGAIWDYFGLVFVGQGKMC